MSDQVWAQTVPVGDDEPAISQEELIDPAFVPGSGSIFVIQACPNACLIQEWDPINKLLVNQFNINAGNGRGLAFDGTDLWYSSLNDPVIHKIAITGGPDITTIPAPAPALDFVGGLDFDFTTNTLVVISESFGDPISQISVIDPTNGNVLADCNQVKTAGESFAIAVDPTGNTFWSNGGLGATTLDEYFLPSIPNQGACTPTGNSFNPTSVPVDFLDFDVAGSFITGGVSAAIPIFDLDGDPTAPPVDSFLTNILKTDITTTAVPEPIVGGELLPIDTTALLLAGAQTNAVWILSALAVIGSVAFGALYITSKKN